MSDSRNIQGLFTKNRAEELGYDVWAHFVVPPFFDRLDIKSARKPRVFIGGRGCGKTMLLRYLSHQSMFSEARPAIPDEAIGYIGIYWRADTQFANSMTKRGVDDDEWLSAFGHMAALTIAMEILASLTSIAKSASTLLSATDIANVDLGRLRAFDARMPASAEELATFLEEQMWKFEGWVNDVKRSERPSFLPGTKFISALISLVKAQLPTLHQASFFVYLDEYENLCTYQQEVINTWLKHSQAPLIFNIAMKRNAFVTAKTVGSESISNIHDFRYHDLEDYLLEDDSFKTFAAEILFLQIANANVEFGQALEPDVDLRDPEALLARRHSAYAKKVRDRAEALLPGMTHEELARSVFEDRALSAKLRSRIQRALTERGSKLGAERFFRPEIPEATIVTAALLHRKISPDEILQHLDRLARKEENDFTGKTAWIHNNFIGCLLQLYEPHSRTCPFYAGFNAFCQLSRGNIRHFLELCHKSIYRSTLDSTKVHSIPVAQQAEAARQASAAFLKEVRSFGRQGNRLYTFVVRLGTMFAMAHQRPSQSESEQAHFSIVRGVQELNSEDQEFLREAVKWSVLFEEKATKKKREYELEDVEYVLNPIYAPYFHITYRKKRKVDLSTEDAICLIRGTLDDVFRLFQRCSQEWALKGDNSAPPLFAKFFPEGEP